MAERANRDFDRILSGSKQMERAIAETKGQLQLLDKEIDAAGSFLRDKKAQDNLKEIKGAVAEALKVMKSGEERVRELTQKTQQDKSRYEEMNGRER